MAIAAKGSGGSIKFSGTGGGIRIASLGGGGGGGGGGSPPMTMLGAWYRADDAGVNNGDAVNSWADRSGSGDVLTVPPPKGAPTYLSSVAAFNNQPAVSFSSTGPIGLYHGSYLEKTLPAAYLAGDSAFTIYAVLSVDSHSGFNEIFYYGENGNPPDAGRIALSHRSYFGTPQIGFMGGVNGQPIGGLFYNHTFSTTKIVEIRLAQGASVGSAFQATNGVEATYTPGQSGDYQSTVPQIASPVPAVTMGRGVFDGKIAEIIYYKKEHDSSERAATLSYLSSRYGISI